MSTMRAGVLIGGAFFLGAGGWQVLSQVRVVVILSLQSGSISRLQGAADRADTAFTVTSETQRPEDPCREPGPRL